MKKVLLTIAAAAVVSISFFATVGSKNSNQHLTNKPDTVVQQFADDPTGAQNITKAPDDSLTSGYDNEQFYDQQFKFTTKPADTDYGVALLADRNLVIWGTYAGISAPWQSYGISYPGQSPGHR